MKIARVFPTKTSMSPLDRDAYFGTPELFMPNYDEIHISVVFTWNIEQAYFFKKQWECIAPVKIGGPAINGEPTNSFVPGKYLKKGITITSRGCPNHCSWCFVKQDLIELNIIPGNNIVDNNLLACSKSHINKVFEMLKGQRNVNFSGGLDSRLITNNIAEQLRGLSIKRMYLAYDNLAYLKSLKKSIDILKKYFSSNYIYCYVLIGYKNDSIEKARERLITVCDLGIMPFAMLYRNQLGKYPKPKKEWRQFQRIWCRPAAIRKKLKI